MPPKATETPDLTLILGGRDRRQIQKQIILELTRLPGKENLPLIGELNAQLKPRGRLRLATKGAASVDSAIELFHRRLRICRLAVAALGSWRTARSWLWEPSEILSGEVPITAASDPDRESEIRDALLALGNLFRDT